jgi:hypothetical protein
LLLPASLLLAFAGTLCVLFSPLFPTGPVSERLNPGAPLAPSLVAAPAPLAPPLVAAPAPLASSLIVEGLLLDGGRQGEISGRPNEDGRPDLAWGSGTWSIVLRDVAWNELSRYPFQPTWSADHWAEFRFVVPDRNDSTCVHLEGPEGELDWKPIVRG